MGALSGDASPDKGFGPFRLLGADASVLLSALPDYVYVPDEVLSGLGETFIYLPQLCRGGEHQRFCCTSDSCRRRV
ncbi:MAG: hypothetical protein AB8H86_34245, partial [Polyangiales bacterium]